MLSQVPSFLLRVRPPPKKYSSFGPPSIAAFRRWNAVRRHSNAAILPKVSPRLTATADKSTHRTRRTPSRRRLGPSPTRPSSQAERPWTRTATTRVSPRRSAVNVRRVMRSRGRKLERKGAAQYVAGLDGRAVPHSNTMLWMRSADRPGGIVRDFWHFFAATHPRQWGLAHAFDGCGILHVARFQATMFKTVSSWICYSCSLSFIFVELQYDEFYLADEPESRSLERASPELVRFRGSAPYSALPCNTTSNPNETINETFSLAAFFVSISEPAKLQQFERKQTSHPPTHIAMRAVW